MHTNLPEYLFQMVAPLFSLLCILVAAVPTLGGHVTEYPHHTVTYNPGQDCLPYDGSVVPNCLNYIDPATKQPVYHIHSASKLPAFYGHGFIHYHY